MKKVLFATTALVASAGIAAADMSLNGEAKVYLDNTGSGDTFLVTDIDFGVSGKLETDNGLTFGASIDLDDTDASDENGIVEDAEIYVKGSFGQITFGDVAQATDAIGLPDIGVDGIGANCGQGIEAFLPICTRLRQATDLPLWMKPNAGLPEVIDDQTFFRATARV